MGRGASLLVSAALALAAGSPAFAANFTIGTVEPVHFTALGLIGTLGGEASGASYGAMQSGLGSRDGATGYLLLEPQLETVLDNAWELGFRSSILAYHDSLSGDIYGNDVFEKAYAFLQTRYGRIEVGQQDGAGTKLSFVGPSVDEDVSLNDANVSFFRDPATHRALIDVFPMRTEMFASANDAKISYYIPHLTDFQVGISWTPNAAKGALPFIDAGRHVANRPANILEAAANYAGYFGEAVIRAYASIGIAHNDAPTRGHANLRDWALGAQLDYNFGATRMALGASYRRANSYAFDVDQPFEHAATHAARLSGAAFWGKWRAGLEYEIAHTPPQGTLPSLSESGYQASVGYKFTTQLQLTGGWQHLRFSRSSGSFYGTLSRIKGSVFFLHTAFRV